MSRAPTLRRRAVGRALVGVMFAAMLVVVGPGVVRFVLGYHDVALLPDTIHICGRNYLTDETRRIWTRAEADATGPTIVVEPGLFGLTACRPGVCTESPDGPCSTVIFVRVDQDAYVGYSLEGGP